MHSLKVCSAQGQVWTYLAKYKIPQAITTLNAYANHYNIMS